jgi:hypothetical protein
MTSTNDQIPSKPTLDYAAPAPPQSRAAFWTGWVLTILPVLMFMMGPVMLLTNRAEMVKGMGKYGYAERYVVPLVVVQVVCTLLYVIPQTAVLGAVLITGWLGGAVATHVRAEEAWFLPVIVGIVVWLGLFLRDRRVRALMPLRS